MNRDAFFITMSLTGEGSPSKFSVNRTRNRKEPPVAFHFACLSVVKPGTGHPSCIKAVAAVPSIAARQSVSGWRHGSPRHLWKEMATLLSLLVMLGMGLTEAAPYGPVVFVRFQIEASKLAANSEASSTDRRPGSSRFHLLLV